VSEETRHPDLELALRLRGGDDVAFAAFARAQHPVLVRFAAARFERQSALVDEVVQEAWVLFLESLGAYEGRSSLRTFLLGILVNVLRNRARAEGRSVPFSALGEGVEGDEGPVVAADRFLGEGAKWAGHWAAAPPRWDLDPVHQGELRAALAKAIAALPEAQRDVLTLRDVHGLEASEVCNVLGLTDIHQRVLLHRARGKVRGALEARFGEGL
jgi:RNA polymerase sigma-70 factor, ECF subfamily